MLAAFGHMTLNTLRDQGSSLYLSAEAARGKC
jgi:hypothetical protein